MEKSHQWWFVKMQFSVTYRPIILLNVSEPKLTTATMMWRDIFIFEWDKALAYTSVNCQFMQQAHERKRVCHFLCYCTFLHHWVLNIAASESAKSHVGWETVGCGWQCLFFLRCATTGCRLQDVLLTFFRNQQRGIFNWWTEKHVCLYSFYMAAFSKSKKKRELFERNMKSITETQRCIHNQSFLVRLSHQVCTC